MPQPIHIRPARADEAAVLTRIAHASKRHWGYAEADIARWSSELTLTPAFIETHSVFVAARGGEPVGLCALTIAGEDAEVEHLWILPEAIGAGAGRALMEHAMAVARNAGVVRLRVVSDPNATGFYERLGGRHVDDEPSTPTGRTLPVLILDL